MGRQAIHAPVRARPARRAGPAWALWAFWVTVAFIPIHAYWALGGSFWLPPAARLPANQHAVQVANWGVCVMLAVGAAILLALARPVRHGSHRVLLLAPVWIGSVVALSHAVLGFVTKSLYVAGLHGAVDFPALPGTSAATAAAQNHRRGPRPRRVRVRPVEGILLLLAGRASLRGPSARRWTVSVLVGVSLILTFGALLVLGKHHVAVFEPRRDGSEGVPGPGNVPALTSSA